MHTLTTLFDWLLTASLRASALTLGVWLVQVLLQKHLSPRWRYALWLPVLVVLLMPVRPESRWSAESVFIQAPQAQAVPTLPVVANAKPLALPHATVASVMPAFTIQWPQVRVLTWAGGALLVMLVIGGSFVRTLARVRASREGISDELTTCLDEVTREIGLLQQPRLLISPQVTSPAVTGVLRPLLLLPPGFDHDFTAEEKRLILQHELTHVKRHDLPLNALLCVLMALHWFNPLLWLAFLKVRADREAACDAQVLANASAQRRSAYGHALLKIESAFAPLRLSLGFIGILQRHASLRARIRSIAAPTRTRPWTGWLAIAAMLAMTFLGVTRAEKAGPVDQAAKLMGLEVKVIEFKEPSNWDIGGRLPPADLNKKTYLKLDTLGPKELSQLLIEMQRQQGAHVSAYPRMVVRAGEKATIRSVVNQPIASNKKDKDGKPVIEYLPIGLIGNFVVKPLKDGGFALDLHIVNSRIVELQRIAGNDYPVATSQVYESPVELAPGMSAVVYGRQEEWEKGKQQPSRPVLFVVTPTELQPKEDAAIKASSPPLTITADKIIQDSTLGGLRYRGKAKLETQGKDGTAITATSDDMLHLERTDSITIRSPLECTMGGMRISCDEQGGEAVLDLKTGKLSTQGASFKTELLSKPSPRKPAVDARVEKLRTAKEQPYDFNKANLGDVLRYVASDAKLDFTLPPPETPLMSVLVSFSIRSSPFKVLETLCKQYGFMLVFSNNVCHIRPVDDVELVGSWYALPKSGLKPAEALAALQKLVEAPATVKLDEAKGMIYINATRFQHSLVEGYLQGLEDKP